jgi:ABC-type polysaccharide/polyol phosphate transport system ATPase subunit
MSSTMLSDEILNLTNVDIVFNSYVYKHETLRDSFIRSLQGPFGDRGHINSLHVLKKIDLKVKVGERIGVLGHNGSGKTTLCRCIAGMLTPSSGHVELKGTCRAIFDTGTGILPQLTGRENAHLLSIMMYPDLSKKERKVLLDEALEFSELGDFLDTPYVNYSKGMQARLCLSVLSAKECELLVLDEVFDGADIFFQEKITKRVLTLMEKSGSVLFVSHNLNQVRMACNQVIVLDQGRVWFKGGVEEGIKLYGAMG